MWKVEEIVELVEMAEETAMSELAEFGFVEGPEPFYERLLVEDDESCLAFCASRDERREAFGGAWM